MVDTLAQSAVLVGQRSLYVQVGKSFRPDIGLQSRPRLEPVLMGCWSYPSKSRLRFPVIIVSGYLQKVFDDS
jgi:hypothetical protein